MAPHNKPLHGGESAAPRWLGSVARREGSRTTGDGWTEKEAGDAPQPRWLGSVARRDGSRTVGSGWSEREQAEGPRWLGSVTRRGEQRSAVERPRPDGEFTHPLHLVDTPPTSAPSAVEPEQPAEPVSWQGSGGRARLNEVRQVEPEIAPDPPMPIDELGERREGRYVVGALGMRLRVVA
jgi:hypothetical protein